MTEKQRTKAIALGNENDYLKDEIGKLEKELIEQKEGNTDEDIIEKSSLNYIKKE